MPNFDVSRIAGNIGALNALNAMTNINKQLATHQARLASGRRINTAEDDPAGLTIATKLQARSEGLKVALSNIGDAKNLLAVAESGLGRINDILVQMRNKAEAGASDTMGAEERSAIVDQLKAYAAQIDDIATQTVWNGNELITGKYFSTALSFQTGAGASDFTAMNGIENLGATGSANGRDSLKIADKTTSASATEVTDADTLTSAWVAGAASNTNLSQLGSGLYTVKVTMNAGTATDDKVELLDSSGSAMLIGQTITDGTGTVAKSVMVDLDTAQTVNFGNGLTVTLAGGKAAGTYSASVRFTPSGDYVVKASGDSGNDLSSGTATDFRAYMSYIEGKLASASSQLAKIGSMNGRLTFKEDQVSAAQLNVEGAYNRIMNANMAEEQVNASKFQILQQTSAAMLAQANAAPQFLLSLFR